ncbi:MAG: hypothetical protein KJ000_15175 [Pirellulaceae bacterium]|nr:hypothetical protein [Pirellulaceae bacterium]
MSCITGTKQGGHIILDRTADWPDGCRVLVEPLVTGESCGLTEEQWDDSPEAIAEWIEWYQSLQPLEISPEEQADEASWRRQIADHERIRENDRLKGLFE